MGQSIVPSAANNGLTTTSANACTNACTENGETAHATADSGGVNAYFGDALKMIASLPLTKAEKADAVRRLLAGKGKA